MPEISRRSLLALGAGMVAGSFLPPSVHRALALAVPEGGLSAIKHVVFLMQENRAFDHYFGTLRGVRGYADRNALPGVFNQSGTLPFSVREAGTRAGREPQFVGALSHYWADGHSAWSKGWYDNWVPAKTAATMAYYDRADLPLQYELAETFTVCDAYHCSVISSTSPNRNYHFTGHTGYEPGSGTKRAIDNAAYTEDTHTGYTWPTLAEVLQQTGHSWQVYQEWDNYQDNNLEFYASFKAVAKKVLPSAYRSTGSFYTAVRAAGADQRQRLLDDVAARAAALDPNDRALYDRGLRRAPAGGLAQWFREDAASGNLPEVSWIVASPADSEHPSASSPIQSARLTYDVLDAIAANPEIWSSTALFITFDENDGYFDHVPPPVPPASVTDEYYQNVPIGMGPRVPMTVVSPWTAGGFTCSQVFDHTSAARFLESWLGVSVPVVGAWRRQVSGDLTGAFDFTGAAPRPAPAQPGAVPSNTGRWQPKPPAAQRMPVQEPGTRPARPLPYQPEASARFAAGALTLELANTGTASVHFALYPYAGEFAAPRHYDVPESATDTIAVPGPGYALTLIGPNGFRREFAGTAAAPAHTVTSAPDPAADRLTLAMTAAAETVFTVTATAHHTGGPWTYQAKEGETVTHVLDLAGTFHWYDVTVTAGPGFTRRLAGHVETGAASVTDPAPPAPEPESLPRTAVVHADSEETERENGAAANAVDSSASTIWHTQWSAAKPAHPHEIQIDLGATRSVSGLRYLPRQDGQPNGRIGGYEIYVSDDLQAWGLAVAAGSFADDAARKSVSFTAKPGRYLRLRALSEAGNRGPWSSAAEIEIMGRPVAPGENL